MRSAHFISAAMGFVALIGAVIGPSGLRAEEKLDTAEILAVAKTSFKADENRLWKSHLTGRFIIVGKDGQADKRNYITFESWVLGDTFRNNSYCDFAVSTFPYARYEDVRTLLLADGALFVTSFSERFKPIGCETRIKQHEFDSSLFRDTYYTVWYHPLTLLKLPFDPTRDDMEGITFKKDKNGILTGTWQPRKNLTCEVQLDSRIGNRAISKKIYSQDKLIHDIKATWKAWPNAGIMLESVSNTTASQNATYTWTLTEFETLKAVNPNKFQPADLGALPGARVIDERDPRNVLINGVPIR